MSLLQSLDRAHALLIESANRHAGTETEKQDREAANDLHELHRCLELLG